MVSLTLDELGAAAAEASAREGRKVLLAARRPDPPADAPVADQLFRVGVVARIEQLGTLPTGATGVVVCGLVRAELIEATQTTPYLCFRFTRRPDVVERTPELEQLMIEVHAAIDAVLELRPGVTHEIRNFVRSIDDPGHLADNTGYSPDYTFAERQALLETFDVVERLRKVREFYRKRRCAASATNTPAKPACATSNARSVRCCAKSPAASAKARLTKLACRSWLMPPSCAQH